MHQIKIMSQQPSILSRNVVLGTKNRLVVTKKNKYKKVITMQNKKKIEESHKKNHRIYTFKTTKLANFFFFFFFVSRFCFCEKKKSVRMCPQKLRFSVALLKQIKLLYRIRPNIISSFGTQRWVNFCALSIGSSAGEKYFLSTVYIMRVLMLVLKFTRNENTYTWYYNTINFVYHTRYIKSSIQIRSSLCIGRVA